ncbi:MAG: right-handed parallel beta-helix repeat-containing protein [Candidatus Nomurabacteria bacterium]|nr:MAG: right-handed parallel beta-helix repeat-containing protein [Candidatus Nomurabacteria bacterium]
MKIIGGFFLRVFGALIFTGLIFILYGWQQVALAASLSDLGPQTVESTPLSQGTLFVAPDGSGTNCTEVSPCSIWTANGKVVPGDVVFLRGGTYALDKKVNMYHTATAANPIVFESYPGEWAVFDGGQNEKGLKVFLQLTGKHIQLRKFEVKNMPVQGIWIGGTDNLLDGIHVHHNALSGIQVYSPYDQYPYDAYGSRNVIRNCTSHDNSDAGLTSSGFGDGNNADGVAISSGEGNRVEHCLVYHNSDDGIDAWRSTNTYFGYNIVHSNGYASGNGNGIKAGSSQGQSFGTIVEHNLSYSNAGYGGIIHNGGVDQTYINNTTWNNATYGLVLSKEVTALNNVTTDPLGPSNPKYADNNSWQRTGTVEFISTNPSSSSFLKPIAGGGFEDIGAYAGVSSGGTTVSLSDLVVESLSYDESTGKFTAVVKNQGAAATPSNKSIGVAFLVDDIEKVQGQTSGPLAVGASVSIVSGSVYTVSEGSHTLTAKVDSNGNISESNESNNNFSQDITIAGSSSNISVGTIDGIGPQPITPTPLSQGTIFVAPNGTGAACTDANPCDIWTAIDKAVAGDVVFLKGGTYQVTKNIYLNNIGTASNPVIYESYPGQKAVFDGASLLRGSWTQLLITGKYIHLRNIEVKGMPRSGIEINGTDNIVDGIHSHHNTLSGISIYSSPNGDDKPNAGSRNIMRNCIAHDNSDAGLTGSGYNDGNNADGLKVHSGFDNRVENCLVYNNSDDGIDTWVSVGTYVGYSIFYSNGLAAGDGNGIKAGGIKAGTTVQGRNAYIDHNISYSNRSRGLDTNQGKNVTFINNTTWNNAARGTFAGDTTMKNNISTDTKIWSVDAGIQVNNSWQRTGTVEFISTNPSSSSFLKPTAGGGFEDIGAYASMVSSNSSSNGSNTQGTSLINNTTSNTTNSLSSGGGSGSSNTANSSNDNLSNTSTGDSVAPTESPITTNSLNNSVMASTQPILTTKMGIGSRGSEVKLLQQLLNRDPVTQVAAYGDGSKGNETDFYGTLTAEAVGKFQIKYGVLQSRNEEGYGNVGPLTLAKLNAVFSTPSPSAELVGQALLMQQINDLLNQVRYLQSLLAQKMNGNIGTVFTRNLAYGSEGEDVRRLQIKLNTDLETQVSLTGDGAPGLETTFFGKGTEAAVKRFQEKYNIINYGTPETTGYGAFGPATRVMMESLY